MKTARGGAAPTPHTTGKKDNSIVCCLKQRIFPSPESHGGPEMTDIPEILRDYIKVDEDDDTSMRLPARDGNRRIGMLIIPEIQYKAWKTFFPKDMEKGPQSRYQQSRRVFFAVDDLPADAPTSINTVEASVFFSGHPDPIHAGEGIGNPPAELPVISYADITRFLETPAPKSQPADPQEPTPAASSEGRPDGSGIPQEMKNANQWLVWRYEVRDGKKTKVPLNPRAFTRTSAPEAAWSYEECKQTADRRGIGIGFSLKNGFAGIDYDHVLDSEGNLKPEYAGLMEEIQALNSYTEVSPSGEGLHVFVRCEDIPPECKAGKHTERGEIYPSGRFFTVTGRIWKESPSQNISIIPAEVYRRVYNRIAGTPAAQPAIQNAAPQKRQNMSDDEAFCRINRMEKGRALWNGDPSGYPSPSEADAALMVMLADITGGDESRMKQLFLSSGLGKREKARRDDYISRTIESACKYVTENKKASPVVVYDDDEPEPEDTYDYEAEDAAIKSLMDRAPEPLKALVDYYNAISPIYQPLFAVESSLIAASEVLSRNWMTDRLVFTGMSMPPSTLNDSSLVIAPTAHGKDVFKDHLQTAIDDPYISMPTGASSRSALHKKLQAYPRTLMIMDEAGKNIAASGRDPSGIKQGAETFAMEIYGRTGRIEPQDYADTKDSPILKTIIRHGLGMVRTTTPETIAAAITYKEVRDGWLPRHRVVVSYRPRPKTIGEYQPNPETKDPKELLSAWNAWKDAHIGIPEVDTHRQAVKPITACVWGYNAPKGVKWNAEDMRNKRLGYEVGRIHPAAETEEVVCDEPIIIKWTAGAAEEISRIYAENEAIPPDNYTCMRHRKVAHIIKIAATIAVLKDGVTKADMDKIHRKYAESKEGRRALSDERAAKKAYFDACGELEKALKSTAKDALKRQQAANAAKIKAESAYTQATMKADLKVRMPIRNAAVAALNVRITAEDVLWGVDYSNLIEGPAKKLIDEELTDIGFIAAMDGLIAYLTKKKNQSATESKITHQCTAVKRLDERGLLKQFWDYAQDTGLVTADKTNNRGRRWYLAQPPATKEDQPKTPTPAQKETETTAEKKGGETASEVADDPFGWARKTAVEQAPPAAPPITPNEEESIPLGDDAS